MCVCVYTYRSFEYMYVSIYTYIYSHTYALVRALWCGLSSSWINQTDCFFSLALLSCMATCKTLYRRDGRRVEILLSFYFYYYYYYYSGCRTK
jgi:hypothetical protein